MAPPSKVVHEDIVCAFHKGEGCANIARRMGCSAATVSYHLRKEGIPKPSVVDGNLIEHMWKDGSARKVIADSLGFFHYGI